MPTSVIETPAPGAGNDERQLQMVLQVLADVRRVELARDADRFELVLRPDAREQQDLG